MLRVRSKVRFALFSAHQVLSTGIEQQWRDYIINNTRRLRFSTDADGSVQAVGDLVRAHRLVVLMKGNPDEPRCGFSNAVCRILEMHGVLAKARAGGDDGAKLFASYDVLQDEDLRSAAKQFADWPTFPQVYLDGEFVGGCDIMLEMHRSGSLASLLTKAGIGSALSSVDSKGGNENSGTT